MGDLPMADDLIRYDLLVQEALRGVVRRVLSNAARDGLPGAHYFHVEFLTAAPGVRLSDRMRERFPERMTIILQHHFWDLEVSEEALEVGLSFGGVGERVRVPFAAVTGFFDESVQFGLRFEVEDAAGALAEEAAPETAKKPARKSKKADAEAAKAETDKADAGKTEPEKAVAGKADTAKAGDKPAAPEAPEEGAKVVSLSAFRKKP
jgi:hypothetical protein